MTSYSAIPLQLSTSVTNTITQVSHGFSVGNVLNFSNGTYALAKADTAIDAEVVGIVSSVVSPNVFTMTTEGYITGLSGLTAGSAYFLSASTAGQLTAIAPSGIGQISKPLFLTDTGTSGYFFNMRGEVIGPGGFGGGLLNMQVFTSSGTYTPTTNTSSVLVYCPGGGGGGGGAGAGSTSAGGTGGTTSFGTLCVAAGGGGAAAAGATSAGANGGAGGLASAGTGTIKLSGSSGQGNGGAGSATVPGGIGADGFLGMGGGAGALNSAGSAAGANTGAGGGGGAGVGGSYNPGAGGGGGALSILYATLNSTQTVTVGSGGTAGTGTLGGGAGGSGIVIVYEYASTTSNNTALANNITGYLPSAITSSGSTSATLTVGTGSCSDSTATIQITNTNTFSWSLANGNTINGYQGGTTLPVSSTIHFFICTGPTGTSATFAGTSLTPTLPSGYNTYYRRIFSLNTGTSGALVTGTADEVHGGALRYYVTTRTQNINTASQGTNQAFYTMNCPIGIKVEIIGYVIGGGTQGCIITSGDETNVGPAAPSVAPAYDFFDSGSTNYPYALSNVITNTSGQIGLRTATNGVTVLGYTRGWTDFRRS